MFSSQVSNNQVIAEIKKITETLATDCKNLNENDKWRIKYKIIFSLGRGKFKGITDRKKDHQL